MVGAVGLAMAHKYIIKVNQILPQIVFPPLVFHFTFFLE